MADLLAVVVIGFWVISLSSHCKHTELGHEVTGLLFRGETRSL